MKILGSSRGQAILEAGLSAVTLIFFIKLTFVAIYTGIAHLWLDHQSYEWAICETMSPRVAGLCRGEFQGRIQSVLKFGEIENMKLYRRQDQIMVKVSFKVINSLKIEKTKTVPNPLIK